MNAAKEKLIKKFIINTSVSGSALRNQGRGIANPIREKLETVFSIKEFFKKLRDRNPAVFKRYLNRVTAKIEGIPGMNGVVPTGDSVLWGTARKCVNLTFRKTVYTGHIWEKYKIKDARFNVNDYLQKLELPLDSNTVKGMKFDCEDFEIPHESATFQNFRIIRLDLQSSNSLQQFADIISRRRNICRIDLDLCYWRRNDID
jgi:hypothetical protein